MVCFVLLHRHLLTQGSLQRPVVGAAALACDAAAFPLVLFVVVALAVCIVSESGSKTDANTSYLFGSIMEATLGQLAVTCSVDEIVYFNIPDGKSDPQMPVRADID